MFPSKEEFEFIPPPEAPVFEPDEEEWKDPLGYIAKIHPYAVKVGICKIRPPPEWQPPFSIDVDKFRFSPRIQKLNELEAKTRVKLNFIDAIAKFWELQGSQVKLPNVEKKPLDIHQLHKIVQKEGGFEDVTRLRRWSRIAYLMRYTAPASSAILRRHYEKILYPYDVFMSGAMTGEAENTAPLNKQEIKEEREDADYEPCDEEDDDVMGDDVMGDDVMGDETPPTNVSTRKSRYKTDSVEGSDEVDYSKNSELKKLQFSSPGPKITGRRCKKTNAKYNRKDYLSDAEFQALSSKLSPNKKESNIFDVVKTWVDDYRCKVCENGDDEDCMLLCDNCDASYHTFCLIPPLSSVPPGDWRCPKCLAKECKKKTESYGFEQAKKVYTLEEFGEMADKFKEEYFAMPPTEVPVRVVEKEFWRLVSSLEDDVVVEYAADLHTAEHGSGFPTKKNTEDPDDEEYVNAPWNLNNLPNSDKSILKYITQDISGMKVPWIYVGMCFSSFCWHTEDHWSYSINYHHWGEPKTWYGVPQTEADRLESCVKSVAPELFEKNPDLFHHLVTLCSPMTLMNHGVPVVRTNQYPGEFVITFPRAYHAGFNNGYNCAEAVNFCPADWLVTGQECVQHYQKLRRPTVFSHDELICKMASIPDALDLDLAKKLYENMKTIVENEMKIRGSLKEKGITDRQREAFELINDDERQCSYCKTTIFFSAVVCSCNKKKMGCLKHQDELCSCPDFKKYIRYRYTLEELPEMLANLKKRADSFDNWEKEVQKALSSPDEEKLELSALKDFITEAEESQFPDCELLDQLRVFVAEAEQCAQVANQLLTKKHKTRKTTTTSLPAVPRLSLNELKDFVTQVHNLPCVIKEVFAVDKLMGQVESFRYDAKIVLSSDNYNEKKVIELLEHAETMDIDLLEINDLRLDLKASKWLESIEEILNQEEPISLDVIRSCVDQGIGLRKKQASEKPLSRLKELLYAADRWEEKAKLCLQAKPRHMMGTLEVIVTEASKVKIILPNVSALKDALLKGKEWSTKVEKVQNDDYYPYYDILEALVVRGRPVPVRLEQLPQMESQVAAARAWKDRTSRTFVKKGSNKQLMDLLRPRKDIGKFERKSKKKKALTDKIETSSNEKDHNTKSEKKPDSKSDKKSDVRSSKDKRDRSKDKSDHHDTKPSKVKEEETRDDKRPIGLPVDAINVDEYVAPDPLTVAQGLKQDESLELASMKELRLRNRQKLTDDSIEGPYCLCRKAIDGFMIRCNLCLDWYHSSCICVPKTVHGKPIGKGYTAWGATREVRYLCTLCCRSRRPRLDTILQLLMSLQKLPVRVPEGEALQFLTERAMNWQDRAKQALSDTEIQRVLMEAKSAAEKLISEKQAVSGAGVTQIAILQRLITVQKIQKMEVTTSNLTVNKQVTTEQSIVKIEVVEIEIISPSITPLTTVSTDTSSKLAENTSTTTTKEPDHADLECTEEMGGSPVAAKSNTLIIDNPNVVHLTSAGSSRAQSPIDVCTPLENLTPSSSVSKTTKDKTSNGITMSELCDTLLDQLEELMFEGDLLEVGLDEVPQIWAILQIQRPLLKHTCMVMNAEYRRKIVKDRKKQRKRKIEEAKTVTQATIVSTITTESKTTSSGNSHTNNRTNVAKKIKEEAQVDVVMKEETKTTEPINVEESQDEDDCCARPCGKPLGDEVEWVQCDKCENWYHVVCVGISAQDASKLDIYVCPYCDPPKKLPPPQPAIKEEPMEVDVEPVTETSTVLPVDVPKIPDLSVIAEVAHQIITDQASSKANSTSTTPELSGPPPTLDISPVVQTPSVSVTASPSTLDLNSLICLADVSEKMDVTPISTPSSENNDTSSLDSNKPTVNTHDVTVSPVVAPTGENSLLVNNKTNLLNEEAKNT